MEKKTKTTEISAAKWRGSNGMAWKQIVYFLRLPDLANLCCCSSVLNSIGKVDRVPWKELSVVMNNDMRQAVWVDKPTGIGQLIYRWFALHTASDNMQHCLLEYFGKTIITTQLHYAATKSLISRLHSPTKYCLFCFDAAENSMTLFANDDLYPKKLHCGNWKEGNGFCHPHQYGLSFSKLRPYSLAVHSCADGHGNNAFWLSNDGVRYREARGNESIIDVRTGLRKATQHMFGETTGPDDGYPTCKHLRCANTTADGEMRDDMLKEHLNLTEQEFFAPDIQWFDPKKLSIADFKKA